MDRLAGWLGSLPPHTLALSLPYAIALSLVAAEVAWLAGEPGARRTAVLKSAAVASFMGLVAILIGFVYAGILERLWSFAGRFAWERSARLWEEYPVLGGLAAFVAWDFTGWVYHLAGHRTEIGWAAHRPHHTGTEFNATLGLRQTWTPIYGLIIHPWLALLGFDLLTVMVCAAISNSWQILEHTSMPVRFPRWLSNHVMTPAAHRHHHGLEGGAVNLGPFFTWWDRMSGTWVPAEAPAPERYGIEGETSNNPFELELAGWRELLAPTTALQKDRELAAQ